MYDHVDWNIDFVKYLPILRAEYNKCNIWPRFEDHREFESVLTKEALETKASAYDLIYLCDKLIGREESGSMDYERMVKRVKSQAVKTITEALHVIAVCDKRENDSKSQVDRR